MTATGPAAPLSLVAEPQPGDIVRFENDRYGMNTHAGTLAVIDGSHFGLDFEDGKGPIVLAVVTGEAFYGRSNARAATPEYVSASGGPCPFIPLAELVAVGRTTGHFWRWKDYPRKGGAEPYTREVALWAWTPGERT